MKILYIDTIKAIHAKSNVYGLMSAFQQFGEVKDFDYRTLAKISSKESMNKTLLKYALQWKPDFIFIGKGESVSGETVEQIKNTLREKVFIVSFLGDFYWEPAPFKVEQSKFVDLNLFSYYESGILDEYKKLGATNIGYWNDGCDPEMNQNLKMEKDVDVSFFGSNYLEINNYLENYQIRYDMMRRLNDACNLVIYGKGWNKKEFRNIRGWVTDKDKTVAVNRSKITVGVTAVDNAYLYLSWPRVFQTMACGTMHMTQYVPGLEEIFENKKHIVWFKDIDECVDLVKYYLKHDDEREKIAETGREYTLKNHAYRNRVSGIIDMKIKDEKNIYSYLGMKEKR